MCIHQEEITRITRTIHACADEFVAELRRNIKVTNLNDQLENKFVQYVAAQVVAAQKRVRKIGPHCWFCGCDSKIVRCDCGFGESFFCGERNTCQDCATAHRKIASHLRHVFTFPRSNAVSSRRMRGFWLLQEAAEALDEAVIDEGRPEMVDTLWSHLCNAADDDEDEGIDLKRGAPAAFRAAKFTRFKELARELDKQIDASMQRSTAKLLRFLR